MKRALNIVLILAYVTSFAQEKKEEVYSVYFSANSLSSLKQVSAISTNFFKKYQPEKNDKNQLRNAAGEYLIVDASGVYLEKNKLLFITREQVREDGKYQVRDGYLFGVSEHDSLPTALEGENYYFLVPSKTYLYDMKAGPSTLFEGLNQGEYLLLTPEENQIYSAIYLKITSGKLEIRELVLDSENCSVESIKNKEVTKGDFNTYILSPTRDEWTKLFSCFQTYDTYVIAI